MDPSAKSDESMLRLDRLLCAEPLEARWLLNGAAPVADPAGDAGEGPAVEVLENQREEDEGDDGDTLISPSELPPKVLAAFEAALPNATVDEVERETEDGETEFGVSAQADGHRVDVTLTPEGQILEIETFIPADELPPAVLAKLGELAPGMEIEEAAVVTRGGVESYEVAYVNAAGENWEANLLVAGATAPGDGGDEEANFEVPLLDSPLTVFAGSTSDEAPDDLESVLQAADATAAPVEAAEAVAAREEDEPTDAQAQQRDAARAEAQEIDLFASLRRADGSDRVAAALEALALGRGASVWLPHVAGVLDDVLPIDLASVERRINQLLDEVDALSGRMLGDTSLGTLAVRLAVVGAFIAGVQLALIRLRVPRGGPVFVFNQNNSSWSWILGSTTFDRR